MIVHADDDTIELLEKICNSVRLLLKTAATRLSLSKHSFMNVWILALVTGGFTWFFEGILTIAKIRKDIAMTIMIARK